MINALNAYMLSFYEFFYNLIWWDLNPDVLYSSQLTECGNL